MLVIGNGIASEFQSGLKAHCVMLFKRSPGAGQAASASQEGLVTAGFVNVRIAIIVATLLLLWGLRQLAPVNNCTHAIR